MSAARTPVAQLVAQGDIDMAGYRLLNLDLSSLASGAPFIDDTALIKSSAEATALAHFKLSWTTPGVHRTFDLPNYDGTMATVDGVEDLTNKSLNGITFGGTGGFTLTDAVISITGGLITNGDLDLGSGHELRLDTTGDTILTLPTSGTVATTAQLPVISDVAYNATTWNGNLDGATKNVLRDKFESLLTAPFADSTALISGSSDGTKLLKFEIDGFTTETTRTLTVQNKSGTIACLDDIPDVAGIIFSADEVGRQLFLAGDVSFFGKFTLAGGFDAEFNLTAATSVTFPIEGTLATRAGEETLTNKTINGGEANSLEVLSILPEGTTYPLRLQVANGGFSAERTLTLGTGDADRSLLLGGDFSSGGAVAFANAFSTLGAFSIALTATGATALTLPTAGTLASFVSGQMVVGGTVAVITAGAGSPEGVVSAPRGSIYLNTSGGANVSIYVKESGGTGDTGWVGK